jgi:hypothetical protein
MSSLMGFMESSFDARPWNDTSYLLFYLLYDDVLRISIECSLHLLPQDMVAISSTLI